MLQISEIMANSMTELIYRAIWDIKISNEKSIFPLKNGLISLHWKEEREFSQTFEIWEKIVAYTHNAIEIQ